MTDEALTSTFDPAPAPAQPNRLMRWWYALPATRQDRIAALSPAAAIVLFLLAIGFTFAYLRMEELGREQSALSQDVGYVQQRLKTRLLEQQEQLVGLAMSYGGKLVSDEEFVNQSQSFINRYPEVYAISWVGPNQEILSGYYSPAIINSLLYSNGAALHISPTDAATFAEASKTHQPVYSQPIIQAATQVNEQVQEKTASLQLQIPFGPPGDLQGMLVVEYSIDGLLRYGLPNESRSNYMTSLFSAKGDFLTGALPQKTEAPARWPWLQRRTLTQSVALDPVGDSLVLQAQTLTSKQGTVGDMFLWLVGGLSLLTAYMLFVNWRHTRLRARAQLALQHEIAFRRAMENSMPIGMRALDMAGMITYVNPAFCNITGWDEKTLIGQHPPYPYWLEGMSAYANPDLPSSFNDDGTADTQYRLQRRSGALFDARIHISPLVNEHGQQTGWMTSLTDVTEATQIRKQLSEAHDRFTAVLEAFVGAVSVISLRDHELLFMNKNYRDWFGMDASGHLLLANQQRLQKGPGRFVRGGESAVDSGMPSSGFASQSHSAQDSEAQAQTEVEYFLEEQNRWLGVRTRVMTWTDGRPAQLLIANDISARKQAEAVAAAHTERAMASNHLVTMGEMASSVAHELNQPLTAINNYCNGMISRIDQGQIVDVHDLIAPLQKTAKQAERAAQIILRIRSFVKRSAPNRAWARPHELVAEAYELFELELRKRKARFYTHFAPDLPALCLDPILIEQVIVNLVKNAAEALDLAHIAEGARSVLLRVQPTAEHDAVEFAVLDNGKGLTPEVERHLFDAFYSTKKEGMGIGLNLCRSIIEAHGGKLRAQNRYNESGSAVTGCCFSFTIPLQPSLQADDSLPIPVGE